jgi:hypothetical protein
MSLSFSSAGLFSLLYLLPIAILLISGRPALPCSIDSWFGTGWVIWEKVTNARDAAQQAVKIRPDRLWSAFLFQQGCKPGEVS